MSATDEGNVVAAVGKDEVQLYLVSPGKEPLLISSLPLGLPTAEAFSWNSDGTLFARVNPNGGVTVQAFPSFDVLLEVPPLIKGIKSFYFSPDSTYLVVADRFEPKVSRDNCALWHIPKKIKVGDIKVKRLASPLWPCMRWSPKESICLRMTQEDGGVERLLVLNSKANRSETLELRGVSAIELSPNEDGLLACFFARGDDLKSSTKPKLVIYDLSKNSDPIFTLELTEDPADSGIISWNCTGDAIMLHATVEVDETGKTYYGKSNLYVIARAADGSWSGSRAAVAIGSPLHDAKWSPRDPRSFVAVAGKMPAQVGYYTVDDATSRVSLTFSMGQAARNTVRWNPHSRFVAVGGFGNLPGDLDLWEIKSRKVVKTLRVECTVECSWCPNGDRIFMSATTTPRMRVDNCIQLFNYDGGKLAKLDFKQLFAAYWRPVLAETLIADKAASPRALATASDGPAKAESRAAYRPPGAQDSSDGTFAAVVRGDLTVDHLSEDKRREVLSGRGRGLVKQSTGSKPSKWDDVTEVARQVPKSVPCPETDWYYKDPNGIEHGPYTKKMMFAWNKAGYFTGELELAVGKGKTYTKLKDLFPTEAPFDAQMMWPWKD